MVNKIEQAFAACKENDVNALRDALSGQDAADVNSINAEGSSLIKLAAVNGNVAATEELLGRGAEHAGLAELEEVKQNPQLAELLQAHSQSGQTGDETHHQMPYDLQGGLLPDGTGNYMQSAPFSPQAGPVYPGLQPHFMPDGSGPFFFPPSGLPQGQPFGMPASVQAPFQQVPPQPQQQAGQMHNLPPPEVAKNIPCKFFPNCRYGDQCVFNHPSGVANVIPPAGPAQPAGSGLPGSAPSGPNGPAVPMSPSQQHPPSSNATSPPMTAQSPVPGAPMFFQPPPGYAYGSPFGVPAQPFYMGPPPMQYPGMPPMQFIPPPLQQQSRDQNGQPDAQQLSQLQDGVLSSQGENALDGTVQAGGEVSTEARQTDVTGESNGVPEDVTKSHLRRQSFGSFLHHHAIPFEPSSASTLAMMNMVQQPYMGANGGGFFPRSKSSKRGGKRGANGERQQCTFFMRGKCRFGDGCLNAHIGADGTDVRKGKLPEEPAKSAARASGKAKESSSTAAATSAVTASSASAAPATTAASTEPVANEAATTSTDSKAQPSTVNETESKEEKAPAAPATSSTAPSAPNAPAGAPRAPASSRPFTGNGQQMHFGRGGLSGARGGRAAAAVKKATSQQRVPNGDDFPALPLSPNVSAPHTPPVNTTAAAPSATNVPASPTASQQATSTGSSAPKVNFSAVLSAPAPPKPVKSEGERETASTSENATQKDSAVGEKEAEPKATAASILANGASAAKNPSAQAAPAVNGHADSRANDKSRPAHPQQVNGGHKKAPLVNGNGRANPVKVNGSAASKQSAAPAKQPQPAGDDDFTPVKGKHAAKRSSVLPTKGINVANASVEEPSASTAGEDLTSNIPKAVVA